MAEPNLPKYRCHKEVWAIRIREIHLVSDASAPHGIIIKLVPDTYPEFEVDTDYYFKHDPKPGGYFVQYQDGYKSFSPAKSFEEGYTLIRPTS